MNFTRVRANYHLSDKLLERRHRPRRTGGTLRALDEKLALGRIALPAPPPLGRGVGFSSGLLPGCHSGSLMQTTAVPQLQNLWLRWGNQAIRIIATNRKLEKRASSQSESGPRAARGTQQPVRSGRSAPCSTAPSPRTAP